MNKPFLDFFKIDFQWVLRPKTGSYPEAGQGVMTFLDDFPSAF
jgi:hypothetical protein